MSPSRAKSNSKIKVVTGRPWLFGGGSDVGRERAHNEDAILVDGERKLVVLADGMGGYQAGEVASQLAVDVVRDDSSHLEISEADLELRGPGEFLGRRQSGLPGFKMANLVRDIAILKEARDAAKKLLKQDPHLSRPEHAMLKAEFEKAKANIVG